MDRSLDEILAERQSKNAGRARGSRNGGSGSGGGGGGSRRRERQDYPRDGVRKSYRDEPRNLDSEWVHDRFDDNDSRRGRLPRRRAESAEQEPGGPRGTKIRVDNIHYDVTEEDLQGLFSRIGPVLELDLLYDRSGRSEGTAYVVYESYKDATLAVKDFDGANAAGQPIRLTILPSGPSSRRNPFDTAIKPGRPLSERITAPSSRTRSLSPRQELEANAARRGIDRYIPSGSRSRSPYAPSRREGGRRPGARRERGGRSQQGEEGGGRAERHARPKKTQEELDAEMEDYFGGGGGGGGGGAAAAATTAAAPVANGGHAGDDDIDMIA